MKTLRFLGFAAAWLTHLSVASADVPPSCGSLDDKVTCAQSDVGSPCASGGTCYEMSCSTGASLAQMKVYKCDTCPPVIDAGAATCQTLAHFGTSCGNDAGTCTKSPFWCGSTFTCYGTPPPHPIVDSGTDAAAHSSDASPKSDATATSSDASPSSDAAASDPAPSSDAALVGDGSTVGTPKADAATAVDGSPAILMLPDAAPVTADADVGARADSGSPAHVDAGQKPASDNANSDSGGGCSLGEFARRARPAGLSSIMLAAGALALLVDRARGRRKKR